MTVSLTYGKWFIACEMTKHGKFIAYGCSVPIPANPAFLLLRKDLYFQMAETQEKAIAKLKEELDKGK